MPETVNPFPHEGACTACCAAHKCNYCGGTLASGNCTNGRCIPCHDRVCTPGGSTSPGHDFGLQGGPHAS